MAFGAVRAVDSVSFTVADDTSNLASFLKINGTSTATPSVTELLPIPEIGRDDAPKKVAGTLITTGENEFIAFPKGTWTAGQLTMDEGTECALHDF